MSIDLLVLLVSNITNFILGSIVLSRNIKNRVNQIFAGFTLSAILWTTFNYLADNAQQNNLLYTRLTFASSVALIFMLVALSRSFPGKGSAEKKLYNRIQIYLTLFVIPVTLLPGFVDSVTKTSTGVQLEVGPMYLIFIVYLVQALLIFIYNFIMQYKESADSRRRNQIRLILTGVLLYAGFAILSNVILPAVIDNWSPSRLGPIFTVFIIGMTGYAIVKHRLFDIRLVVARTLGYVFSVGSLALLYSILAFFVIDSLLPRVSSDTVRQFEYTLLAVVLAFTFQPLKRFFDRWSNKLFYRDAYDSQELLNQLNTVLVSTIELEKLLGNSANVIGSTLKADFCMFGIKEIGRSPQRIVGTASKEFSGTDIAAVRSVTPKLKIKTIVADELGEAHVNLKDVMRKNDIAVMVRLTDTPTKNQEGLGYMVLGAKKSGSPYTQQDIKILEIIADELVIAIQNALRFEEIKNFNVTLQEKVDDATKKLRKANQRLIELDQTKDDFISMASHQLRTPLTSVKGYISMVMEGDVGKVSKKQNELLDQAFVSAQRMVYLIADLLNVSRLRTGKFIIEPKETNLADIIEGEISQLKETAKGRNLELTYDKPKDFPTLMLDETKIRQVIMNFADNAIYYTPTGGHIKVGLEDKGDSIEFTVSDDGIGVPKLEQHHLFNKFYRANNAKKTRPDGTGLGLFMAKKVVVAQGGSIIFNSQEGKGSTFGFSFTKKQLLPENFKGVAQPAEKDAR